MMYVAGVFSLKARAGKVPDAPFTRRLCVVVVVVVVAAAAAAAAAGAAVL